MDSISILSFSWNTQSNRLCESLDPKVVEYNRSGYFSTWKYNGNIADFWVFMEKKITEKQPTIAVFSFQEDVSPGSYFHSHLLPQKMEELKYRGFDRTKQMGIGKTCLQGLYRSDFFIRGLRTSVYIRKDCVHLFPHRYNSKNYTSSIFQNKGASAIYVSLPQLTSNFDEILTQPNVTNKECKILAIINTHLPFDSSSLIETVQKKDFMIRQDAVFDQNKFLNDMYRSLILEVEAKPDYVICMGDFNYRYLPFANWSGRLSGEVILSHFSAEPSFNVEYTEQIIRDNDELRIQMNKGNIYSFEEGLNNSGPYFAPTGKLKHDRKSGCFSIENYALGKYDQRVPSHSDRILHKNLNSNYLLRCLEYKNFDYGMMNLSDHAGIYALHLIQLNDLQNSTNE